MKTTGVVRRMDDLGRVVIPMELRRTMNIAIKDPLEILVDSNSIILRKYEISCTFCGNQEDLQDYKEKKICMDCATNIAEEMKEAAH